MAQDMSAKATFERRVADGQDADLTYIAMCELLGECGGYRLAELPALTEVYKRAKAEEHAELKAETERMRRRLAEFERALEGSEMNERN